MVMQGTDDHRETVMNRKKRFGDSFVHRTLTMDEVFWHLKHLCG